MPLRLKIICAFLMLLVSQAGWAAAAHAAGTDKSAPVTLRVGAHDEFTRIVLDCPGLTPYAVETQNEGLRVVLTTAAPAKIVPWRNDLIRRISALPQDGGTLRFDIGLPPDAQYRDYRYENKIIIDVTAKSAAEKKPEAKKPEEKKPEEKKKEPEKKAETPPPPPKKAEAAEAKPAEAPPAPVPAPAAVVAPPVVAPPVAAAPPPPPPPAPEAAPQEADEELASISLSSLSPIRVAVFERGGNLWVVTDSAEAAPSVSGKMAPFITAPKTLRLDNGAAFRYTFPRRMYASVSRQNLSWTIDLHAAPQKLPDGVPLAMRFDKKNGQAMMLAPLKTAGDVISFKDPEAGDTLAVTPVSKPAERIAETRTLTDFETLPAIAGFVMRPLRDGVAASRVFLGEAAPKAGSDAKDEKQTVVVTAPGGLSVTPEGGAAIRLIGDVDAASDDDNNRLFDFPNWRGGGLGTLRDDRSALQDKIAAAETTEERDARLMDLARLYFANNFGHEALGVLDLIRADSPDAEKNPDFLAVRGAAEAMAGRYKEALADLSFPALQGKPEAMLWQGYAAAATEQWHMADRAFPQSNRLLLQYPDNIAIPLTIYMAESALHLGRADTGRALLDSINRNSGALTSAHRAAIDYLNGIALAQKNDADDAIALWTPVAGGLDRLYHAKAGLSLARLLLDKKKISLKEAIERVDSLRFAWRGDGLETVILQTLGEMKIQDGQILSGLEDLRNAADLADAMLDDAAPIRAEMRDTVVSLFTTKAGEKLKPIEMVSVYGGFSNLIPPGPEADAAAAGYVDNLIRVDLLSEAASALEKKIGSGTADAATGEKLAAVYLFDGKPGLARAALDKTESFPADDRQKQERALLRARTLSEDGKPDEAIAAIGAIDTPDAKQLKADIYWRARKWPEAGAAIEAVLPEGGARLGDADAALVVNAAVAWRMAGDADKLRDLRARYADAMRASSLADTFAVAARDGGASSLADRETLMGTVGEVDMFRGFLDQYRAGLGSSAANTKDSGAKDSGAAADTKDAAPADAGKGG